MGLVLVSQKQLRVLLPPNKNALSSCSLERVKQVTHERGDADELTLLVKARNLVSREKVRYAGRMPAYRIRKKRW
jgi:hypothetical protein